MSGPYDNLYLPIPDINAYLRRIGLQETPEPTIDNLNLLIWAHLTTIPFENLDVFYRKTPPSLETPVLFDKIVTRRRGGYCFELNGLFQKLLAGLGYECYSAAVRIHNGKSFYPPISHRAVVAVLDGAHYYCDVGFGGPCPISAILIENDSAWQKSGSRSYKSEQDGTLTRIIMSSEGEESLLFSFEDRKCDEVDFLGPNYLMAADPGSYFRTKLLVSRLDTEGYQSIDNDLYRRKNGSSLEERVLSQQELSRVLEEGFGIRI